MRKHILIISLHADPMLPAGIGEYGGGHMYPRELLIGLAGENFTVSLITRKNEKTFPEIDVINLHATIYRLDYGVTFQDKKDFYLYREKSYLLTCQLIQKYSLHPDIIHSLYWNSGFLAFQLSKLLHIPYVHSPISVGAIILKEQAKEIEKHRIETEKIVFKNAAKILSITESERQNIIEYYDINPNTIEVIGRPISNEYLYPYHDSWGNLRDDKNNYKSLVVLQSEYTVPVSANWWEKKAYIYMLVEYILTREFIT
ncbi:MAG: glycosyltransferase [Bacteroides thetaiotaomicron]|nr:glycosyltransferase [Bacteroides thetaiotaomicron]